MVVSLFGCAQAKSSLYPAAPLSLTPRDSGDCVEQLLVKSRKAGYLAKSVDREGQRFRAATHVPDSWTLHKGDIVSAKREMWSASGGIATRSRQLVASLPGDVKGQLVVVRFFEVQCREGTATVTPLDTNGAPLPAGALLNDFQAWELTRYAAHLGVPTTALTAYAQ